MTISVNVTNALVGPAHTLSESDISNWIDIIDLITTTPCDFEIHYNGDVLTGSIVKSADELSLLIGFDNPNTALPGGMCLIVDCNIDDGSVDICVPTRVSVQLDSRIMVVDENGCPIGYALLLDVMDAIKDYLGIPKSLCELLVNGIPEGNLVASDRIVTTTGDPACTLKSVPQSQVVCD